MKTLNALCVAILACSSYAWAGTPKTVYKKAGPAVVLILGSDDGKAGSAGTGSIITSEGKVITNAHVVVNEATGKPFKMLYVFLKPNRITGDNAKDLTNRYKGRVLAWSPADELDLALMQIEKSPGNLPTIAFANPDKVEIGDEVVAIGHPEQGGLWTLTTGTISTMIANFNRIKGKNVFQTEASVNRGNSGGPLLDVNGNMVGINTMVARQGAGGIAITDVNFSLKSSVAVKWLTTEGMGLAYAPKPEEQKMVVAVAPEPDKPATSGAEAGQPTGQEVTEPPAATIVVAEEPPAKPETLKEEGKNLGKQKESEKVVAGERLDPKKAKPVYHTKKRPMNLDTLRAKQMKEMEDMMEDMGSKFKRKSAKGMGLW